MRNLSVIILFFFGFSTIVFSQRTAEDGSSEFSSMDFDYSYVEGCKYLALENYVLADQFFTNCLKIKPEDDGTLYNLARIKLYLNDIPSALDLAKKLDAVKPGNIWYSILLSRIFQQVGDLKSAIMVFENIVNLNPGNLDLYFNLNELYISAGLFKKAIKNNKNVEKKFGILEQSVIQQAGLYSRIGKQKLAYEELLKLTQQFPSEVRYYLILAEFCMDNKKFELANTYFNAILKIEPGNGFAHVSLSEYYRQLNKMDSAIFHLSEAFTSRDIDADAKLKLILGFYEIYKTDSNIISQIDSLIVTLSITHPDNLNIQILLANSKLINEQFSEAQSILKNVITQRKDNYQIWEQLLYVDNRLLDFENIYLHSSEAIKFFPNQALLYLFKGLGGLQTNRPLEAEDALSFGVQLVVETDNLYVDFLNYLSEAYYTNQKFESAFATFEKLILIDSLNLGILNNYSYYLSVQKLNLEKALTMSYKTIVSEPENPTFLDTYGWVLFQMEKFEEAKKYLLKATELNEYKNATVVEHLGDVYFKLNDLEEAKRLWNISLNLNEKNEKLIEKIKNLNL